MSMFDTAMAKHVSEFIDTYDIREHEFKRSVGIAATGSDSISLQVRWDGRIQEFLKISIETYDKAIRLPVQCSRLSNNYGQKFFLWHWLEEQNKLDLFFNTLKEIKNA